MSLREGPSARGVPLPCRRRRSGFSGRLRGLQAPRPGSCVLFPLWSWLRHPDCGLCHPFRTSGLIPPSCCRPRRHQELPAASVLEGEWEYEEDHDEEPRPCWLLLETRLFLGFLADSRDASTSDLPIHGKLSAPKSSCTSGSRMPRMLEFQSYPQPNPICKCIRNKPRCMNTPTP